MVAPIQKPVSAPGTPGNVSGVLNRVPARALRPGARAGTVACLPGSTDSVDRIDARDKVVASRKALKRRPTPRDLLTLPSDRSETSEADCIPDAIAPVTPDLQTEMFVLARQTENRLLVLQRDVAECKSVDEAANFTRFLQASGVLALLEKFTCAGNLPVNGPAIRKLSTSILSDCGDLYRNGKATARYAASDIAAINHKLDLIAGRISVLATIPPANSEPERTGSHSPVTHETDAGGST